MSAEEPDILIDGEIFGPLVTTTEVLALFDGEALGVPV